MHFRLLIFDWDGTLMDSAPRIIHSFQQAMKDVALPLLPAETISNVIGLGLEEAILSLYPRQNAEKREALREGYRRHFLSSDYPMPFFRGARETLHALHQAGYLLAVATGKSRAGLERVFQESGLGKLFHSSRCADETRSKPHPQMLHEIMTDLSIESSEALMIGDTEYDLEMAVQAGVASAGVSYGVHAVERLQRHNPLICFHDLSDLPEWLRQYR